MLPKNLIIAGKGNVGKSFLLRAVGNEILKKFELSNWMFSPECGDVVSYKAGTTRVIDVEAEASDEDLQNTLLMDDSHLGGHGRSLPSTGAYGAVVKTRAISTPISMDLGCPSSAPNIRLTCQVDTHCDAVMVIDDSKREGQTLMVTVRLIAISQFYADAEGQSADKRLLVPTLKEDDVTYIVELELPVSQRVE